MDEYRKRVSIFMAMVAVVLAALGFRLGQLQLLDHKEYAAEAQGNAIRQERIRPARGALYDRNGMLMVGNTSTFTVTLTPRYFDESKAPLLADLLGVPDSTVLGELNQARQWSAFQPSLSFPEVAYDVFSRVQERSSELPGVGFDVDQKREYATRARAAHALGYVSEITEPELERLRDDGYRMGDLVGRAGVERTYGPFLQGRTGSEFELVSSRGAEIGSLEGGRRDVDPFGGYDLRLTLDASVQALAESLFVNKRGAAVALDPKTGELISMVSAPDFDPEVFSEPMDQETWAYLTTSEAKPMFNRATMMGLPPGSTWKPFMALVGLQERLITPISLYNDRGGYTLGGHTFSNHAGHVYGPIDVKDAIRVSSNAYFFGDYILDKPKRKGYLMSKKTSRLTARDKPSCPAFPGRRSRPHLP